MCRYSSALTTDSSYANDRLICSNDILVTGRDPGSDKNNERTELESGIEDEQSEGTGDKGFPDGYRASLAWGCRRTWPDDTVAVAEVEAVTYYEHGLEGKWSVCDHCKRGLAIEEGRYFEYDANRGALSWCKKCYPSVVDARRVSNPSSDGRTSIVEERVVGRTLSDCCAEVHDAYKMVLISSFRDPLMHDEIEGVKHSRIPEAQIASLAATAYIQWCKERRT